MVFLLVVVGVVVVVLLWRILGVQKVRAQVEVATLVVNQTVSAVEAFTKRAGTYEDAKQAGRLIEWCEQLVATLNADSEEFKKHMAGTIGQEARRDLVIESVERGVPSRLIDELDYDQFVRKAHYPGAKPVPELMCSNACAPTVELTYMPPDATTCPFCGAPTKPLNPPDLTEKWIATWVADERAWRLWKKRNPVAAEAEEAEVRATDERHLAEERAEFESVLAAFKSKQA